MKTGKILAASIILATLITGCARGNVVEIIEDVSSKALSQEKVDNGEVITKSYDLKDFSSFDTTNSIEVIVTKGDEYRVDVTTNEGIFDILDIKVEGNTLITGFKANTNPDNKKVLIEVVCTEVRAIDLSNSSSMDIQSTFKSNEDVNIDITNSASLKGQLSGKDLNIKASNSASIDLTGSFNKATLEISNSADVDLTNTQINNAVLDLTNSSIITLGVKENIDITASNSASVTVLSGNVIETSVDESVDVKIK